MNIFLFLSLAFLQASPQDSFSVRGELQGLYDEIRAAVQFSSDAAGAATVIVKVTTVRKVSEETVFRDAWVKTDGWKLKSREQLGQPMVLVSPHESRR